MGRMMGRIQDLHAKLGFFAPKPLIPANAGIHGRPEWNPAFAGMRGCKP